MNHIPEKEKLLRVVRPIGAAFLVLGILAILTTITLRFVWKNDIYPGVVIGELDIGKKTPVEVKALLQKKWNSIEAEGIELILNNQRVVIYPTITSPNDPDLTYEVISIDIDKTLNNAIRVGRNRNVIKNTFDTISSIFKQTPIRAKIVVNKETIEEVIHDSFEEQENEAQNALFEFNGDNINVRAERSGYIIDTKKAVEEISNRVKNVDNQPVQLILIEDIPEVTKPDLEKLIPHARSVTENTPITLQAQLDTSNKLLWKQQVDRATLQSWLTAEKTTKKKPKLIFNDEFTAYIEDVATQINQPAQDAKFEINEKGKIIQFQTSRDGFQVDIPASQGQIQKDILKKNSSTSSLVMITLPPSITTAETNNLGITKIIGVGKSNFAGSPRNRRTNIEVSSEKLNGLLIAPGEEFSLVEALKPFTSEAGYVPELVIKGNKLIPEIGGGACQIGTTTFRAALSSGLPITKRRNHSFAVSYYNDDYGLPGTDATIYDPAPDFRFLNDTGSHILIQTHISEDDDLTYEFWGTSDGRTATTSKTAILSKTSAPNTKYIETTDLPPGSTECSGSNVPGYSTVFNYTVNLPNGETREEKFNSQYRPWQRVCLIGIEEEKDSN